MWLKVYTVVLFLGFISEIRALFPLVRHNRIYYYVPPEDEVKVHLYHREDLSNSDDIYVDYEDSLEKSRFDAYLPTKVIIHGWTHGNDVPWIVEMREILAQSGLYNVMVVDWSSLAHVAYVEARIHNTVVAKQLTKLLLLLAHRKGISMSSVHLIGHSMGAQISGSVGRQVNNRLGQKIGRITGLDPAAIFYEWPHIESLDEILDPTDADFIDVIHTNVRHLGIMTPAGHVDYYPNGGEGQEGCFTWSCDHIKACEYFIASLRKPDVFNAFSFGQLKKWDNETQLESYPMGIDASPEIPCGIYYWLIADPATAGNHKYILKEEKYNATNFMTLWEFDGILKYSPLFYGWYTNSDNSKGGYRLPFAYFVTGLVVYGYSFFATLRKMAENSRMSKLSEKDDEYIFSWKLFTAWDYMIGNTETAHNRVASIVMGFKEALLEEAEKKKVTRNWEVISFRILVNTIVLGLLGSSVWAIVMVVRRSTEPEAQDNFWRKNETSFVISLISFIFPMIFEGLGMLEQYHPRKQLRLQLARIMVLNLLNLYSLIFALFGKIDDMTREQEQFRRLMNVSSTTIPSTTSFYTVAPSNSFIETTDCYEECLITETGEELIAENLISELSLNFSNTTIIHLKQLITYFLTNVTSSNSSSTDDNSSMILEIGDFANKTLLNVTQTLIPELNFTNITDTFIDYLTYILYNLNEYNSTVADGETIEDKNGTVTNHSTTMIFEQFTTIFPLINLTETTEGEITLTPTLFTMLNDISTSLNISVTTSTSPPNCRNICTVEKIPWNYGIDTTTSTTPNLEITEMGLNYSMKARLRSLCWETMFGQELIRLTLTDLVMTIVPTLGMDFFRGLFVRYMNRCWCWDLEKKFPQYGDFKVAENILSLVNNQGMVWMGMFFSPGIVLLNVVKLFIFMYFRGWAVMTCNVPHEVIFRASRSNNFYYALLLMMLFLCVLPVGYTIVWITPSWHCGPFSKYERIFHIFTKTIRKSVPQPLQKVLDYIASPGIVIPLLVLLILIIYYLISLTGALREANDDLKIQLRRERTEERRKMFQLVDRRRRVGSGESNELSNTPFNKWKKLLGNLPGVKSMDDNTPKQEENDIQEEASDEEKNENKSTDFFKKLIKRALRKPSTSDEEQHAEDGTDTEQHDSLPYDPTTSKQPKTTKHFPWKTTDFQSIANRALQLTKEKTDNSNDTLDMTTAKKEVETISRQNSDLRGDIHRRDSNVSRKNQPSTSKDIRQDSKSSDWSDDIPVIMISKTESAENILREGANQRKFKPQVKCVLKKQNAEADEETIRYFYNDLEKNKMENDAFKAVAEAKLDSPNVDSIREDLFVEMSSSEGTDQKGSSTDTILLAQFVPEDIN